jgi:8-oxo-dGTP pyrophosphatase MutT (NUDIX family)
MTLFERLEAALAEPPAQPLLAGDAVDLGASEPSVPAAVLIAITERAQPGVILTQRKSDLRTHAGQIAFPGGRIDPGESALQAALREAEEELAMPRAQVRTLGELEPYATVTGYAVTPVIGLIPPDLCLQPHDREVESWFEAPLSFLLDPANHVRRSAIYDGRRRFYYEIGWNGQRIWGATAAMLVNLSRRLRWT